MKRSDILASLAIGTICVSLAGCDHARRQEVRPAMAKEDPSSWSSPPLTKADDDSGSSKGFDGSEARSGALSSRGADIEKSLGVGLGR